MAGGILLVNDLEADSAELASGSGEVGVDELLVQADGLEHLSARIRGDSRDAHLRHNLEYTLAETLNQVLRRLLDGHADYLARLDHLLCRLEGQVWVDSRGAVADQRGNVVHLANVSGLDDQANLGAVAGANQVVVHCRGQ